MNTFFPQAQVSLVFLNGPLTGRHFLVNRSELHIGSSPDNEIVIREQNIFPQHAVISWNNGRFFLRRLNAQGIVAVNQNLIEAQWVPLDFGDVISLGQSAVTFRLVAGDPVPSNPMAGQSTGPQVIIPPSRPAIQPDNINAATIKPAASTEFTSSQQSASPFWDSAESHTETTRYLCMAARIDQGLRNYVFKHIVREKHRAIGESHGVDISAVAKSCLVAQQEVFIRDSILSGLLAILLFLGITTIIGLFKALTQSGVSSAYSFVSAYVLLAAVFLTVASLVLFALFAWLTQIKKIPLPIRVILLLIATLLFFSLGGYLSVLLYVAAWGVIVWNLWNMRYGAKTQQLMKGKFHPDNIQLPNGQQLDPELARLSGQDENIIVYSGSSPFVGSGFNINGWSFALDSRKGKQELGTTLTPQSIKVEDLYACVDGAIRALDLPKLSISDKLYVNGKAIPDVPPYGAKDAKFFDNARRRPLTRMDDALVKRWMEAFSEDVRYYKCFRVISWRGELIISIFIRFMMIEKNLFIEGNYMILPPLKETYYQLDSIEPTFTLEKLWRLIKLSFFSVFPLWFLSPVRAMNYLARDWFARREQEQVERLIASNPAFDYGASESLREAASSSEYRLYFQELDTQMYVKTIESQLLESIANFLDSKNIDTGDLKERQQAILNQGVIVSGGTVESLAFGQNVKAISNRSAEPVSATRGASAKRASQN